MSLTPKPIRTDGSNDFAYRSMAGRLPSIIREVQALNRYTGKIQSALDRLHDALVTDEKIPMFDLPAPDYQQWAYAFTQHRGASWLNAEWFFAETAFFRHVIQAVGYWETERDPFLPKKMQELESDALRDVMEAALETAKQPDNLGQLIEQALWGNRIDLSHPSGLQSGQIADDDDLLVDEREAAVAQIEGGSGTIHVIADNAGTEFAMDLVLIDALLQREIPVMLHLKMHPTYVSDATVADLWLFLRRLQDGQHGDEARALGQRLKDAIDADLLTISPDFYWNSSRFLFDMPMRFYRAFQGARLVIVKGDANYRRVTYDTVFPTTTALADVADYCPAPLLMIRTLKCDVVVGLPEGMAEKLDAISSDWRVTGKYGVLQYVPTKSTSVK